MPCCRFDTHLVYLSYSVRGVPPSLCDRPWQVVWKREQAFCKCQLNLSYCFAVFSCDGPHFFASPTSALCNACLETRLAKWREKEGLIKFIMNCRRVHRTEGEGMQQRTSSRRSVEFSHSETPFLHSFQSCSISQRFPRSLLAARRRDTISVVRTFLRAGHFDTRVSRRSHRSVFARRLLMRK